MHALFLLCKYDAFSPHDFWYDPQTDIKIPWHKYPEYPKYVPSGNLNIKNQYTQVCTVVCAYMVFFIIAEYTHI